MRDSTYLRRAALVAPVVVAGLLAVSVVSAVDIVIERIALEIAAALCIAAATWRAAQLTLPGSAAALVDSEPRTLRVVAHDRRRPIFDRDSGAYSAWYFRLRIEEEISRAERFGERFSIVSISGTATTPLDAGAIADKHWLREVDFAGNLGSTLAVALPKTDRKGAQIFVDRLAPKVANLDVRISEYPGDGKTLDALLGEDEWRSSQPTEDVAV
jgi:hypothetical protein